MVFRKNSMKSVDSSKVLCLAALFCLVLSGCDNSNSESYKDKIARFENRIAQQEVDKGVEAAIALSKQPTSPAETIPTHLSQPIPIIYKKRYEELGFDTSQMNFAQPQWYQNQQQYKTEYETEIVELNSGEYNSHDHQH